MSQSSIFKVEDMYKGERLDVFLTSCMETASRSNIQKLITSGQVTVNNKLAKANHKVQVNELVEIVIPVAVPLEVVAENIPLDILYEDDELIVINKARGMVVHPAAGHQHGTLVNALLGHCKDLSGINGVIRPGIVHRLDKDTSGVMVAAKSDRAHSSLAEQIKVRTASRRYLAILHGNMKDEQGVINAPIGRHPEHRKKMAVVFANSKEAITHFKVIERFDKYTLVECKLQTGRTHQIRVHMAYLGHPVVGDPQYGPERQVFTIVGQALHSKELTFIHPITGEKMLFFAELPSDMQEILKSIRRVH